MSFNRGFRHGDNRTNSSYQPNNQRPMQRISNISPWEGGVVPNSRPSNSQGLLALPTPQLQQNGNNMLSVQQLALASTLLSSLGMNVLPNQQQQQQQQQRVTQQLQFQQSQQRNDNLTTLMGRMGRSQLDMMGNGQPSFRQQGQNNYKFNNNFNGDRFRGMDTMRNRLHQNMTNVRTEPYSKNRPQQSSLQQQQRRTFVNKPTVDRKPTATLTKQGTPAVLEAVDQASKFRKPVKGAESSESEPKEQEVASETVDESVKEAPIILSDGDLANSSTRDEEEVNAKRDWKDEKKDDGNEKVVDPVPPVAVKEELDTSIVIYSKEGVVKDAAEEEKKKSIVFQCHICNVGLMDEKLLQEHIQLESHKTLMEKTSESYQAQAAALRLNMQEAYGRIDSLKRNIRLDQHREFCKMCKLNFAGSIASHRKLKEHLQLKTFLHPRCLTCSKEFTTRIEWDIHKLSVAHQIEQAFAEKAEAKAANAGLGVEKKVKEVERKGYQPQRVYGYHYVSEGFYCRVCEKFFEKRPLSRAHLQSKEHYDLCIAFETKDKEKKINSESTEPNTDLTSSTEESATNADNNPEAEPIVMETEAQAEPESEDSECKRQKLSEDVKEEANTTVSENSQETCSTKAEPGGITQEEENLVLSTENDDLEGDDEAGIAGFLLEDDINMILDESGLDLGMSDKSDVQEEGAKSSPKARRGGRAVRGRKRK